MENLRADPLPIPRILTNTFHHPSIPLHCIRQSISGCLYVFSPPLGRFLIVDKHNKSLRYSWSLRPRATIAPRRMQRDMNLGCSEVKIREYTTEEATVIGSQAKNCTSQKPDRIKSLGSISLVGEASRQGFVGQCAGWTRERA